MDERYETHSIEVTAEAIAAYAAATNDRNQRYQGAAPCAPPMFVVTLSVPFGLTPVVTDPAVIGDPMRLLNLLHGEEDITFHRLVRAGEILRVTPRLVERAAKPAGELLVVANSITDEQGDAVADTQSSLLIRERRVSKLDRESSKTETPVDAPVVRVAMTVDADQSPRYAEASGDRNPIHTDDDLARSVGLRGKVVHGLCTMAMIQREIIDGLAAGAPERLRRLKVRFVKPVYNGDTLTLEVWRAGPGGVAGDLDLAVRNQDGQLVIAGGAASLDV